MLGEWVMGGAVHEAEVTTLLQAQHVLTTVYHNHSMNENTECVCHIRDTPGNLMSQLICVAQVT